MVLIGGSLCLPLTRPPTLTSACVTGSRLPSRSGASSSRGRRTFADLYKVTALLAKIQLRFSGIECPSDNDALQALVEADCPDSSMVAAARTERSAGEDLAQVVLRRLAAPTLPPEKRGERGVSGPRASTRGRLSARKIDDPGGCRSQKYGAGRGFAFSDSGSRPCEGVLRMPSRHLLAYEDVFSERTVRAAARRAWYRPG